MFEDMKLLEVKPGSCAFPWYCSSAHAVRPSNMSEIQSTCAACLCILHAVSSLFLLVFCGTFVYFRCFPFSLFQDRHFFHYSPSECPFRHSFVKVCVCSVQYLDHLWTEVLFIFFWVLLVLSAPAVPHSFGLLCSSDWFSHVQIIWGLDNLWRLHSSACLSSPEACGDCCWVSIPVRP